MHHDLLLCEGKVITLDKKSTIAQAVAIKGERIVGVGATQALRQGAGPGTRIIDLKGRTVLPGFYDAHPHMDREGLKSRGGVPIAGLRSVKDIVGAVEKAVKGKKPGEWVVVMPMGEPPYDYVSRPDQLIDKRFPTRYDLDVVAPDNPVYIRSMWGWWGHPPHPSIANSRALEAAGITRQTWAPYNTEIIKDAKGDPTGVFLERNRAPLLEYTLFNKVPRFDYQDRVESVHRGAKLYSAAGTTSGYEGHGLTPSILRAYKEVHEAGDLSVRMYSPISVPSAAKHDAELSDLMYQWSGTAAGRGMGDDHFRVGGVTLDLADPTLAAVIGQNCCPPYEQWAGHFYQGLSDERFIRLGVEAVKHGLRLNTLICYGLERALRLFEAVDRQVSIRDRRCVGIHLLEGSDEQLKRIRDLGLVVTITPSLLYQHAAGLGLDKLGAAAIPLRRAVDAGIKMSLSTDNVPYSMLFSVWAALTRVSEKDYGPSYLSREEALRMACQTGHYLAWDEDKRGSIEAGKFAELVVLNGDPLTCEVDRIPELGVDVTLLDGRIVHERETQNEGKAS